MPSKDTSSSSSSSSKVHVHAYNATSCNGTRYHVRGQVRAAPNSSK